MAWCSVLNSVALLHKETIEKEENASPLLLNCSLSSHNATHELNSTLQMLDHAQPHYYHCNASWQDAESKAVGSYTGCSHLLAIRSSIDSQIHHNGRFQKYHAFPLISDGEAQVASSHCLSSNYWRHLVLKAVSWQEQKLSFYSPH